MPATSLQRRLLVALCGGRPRQVSLDVLDVDVALGQHHLSQSIVAVNADSDPGRVERRRGSDAYRADGCARREVVRPSSAASAGTRRGVEASAASRLASVRSACARARCAAMSRSSWPRGSGANLASVASAASARCISAVRHPSVAAMSRYAFISVPMGTGGDASSESGACRADSGRSSATTWSNSRPNQSIACVHAVGLAFDRLPRHGEDADASSRCRSRGV